MKKEIYLKRLSFLNFRGIEKQVFEFTNREEFIVGANGTGKSSMFDGFIWCLFGKDQFNRNDYQLFNTKDLSERKKDCEVELTLLVNGQETKLKRIYGQDWSRAKQEAEETFKGHSSKYYINDVKVLAGVYNAEIDTLCSESIFRVITNPSYFPNLKEAEQRAILFKMVGDITDESIAKDNKDFTEFLKMLNGKSFDDFKKEIRAKIKPIKDEVSGIQPRIDEVKRTITEINAQSLDFVQIQVSIDAKKAELKAIDDQLSDVSKVSEKDNAERLKLRGQINELEVINQNMKFVQQRLKEEDLEAIRSEIRKLRLGEGEQNRDFNTKSVRLDHLLKEKERIEAILKPLGNKWKELSAEKLTFKEDEFDCPTCHRPLEVNDIEAKQAEMTENFNKNKSERLKANENEGKSRKAELDKIVEEIESIGELKQADTSDVQTKIEAKENELKELESKPLNYENDEFYVANTANIEKLKATLNKPVGEVDNSELKKSKETITTDIEELNKSLSKKDQIQNAETRIKQLEAQEKTLNQELADLERKEFLQKTFEFAKNTAYESKVNKLFKLVKFNLFRQQVDGQIVPTCEAHVDGVPYSVQNSAMQIAIGLDIIDSIGKHKGIIAPIFVDNRESTSEIPEVKAQIINLVVNADEKQLRML